MGKKRFWGFTLAEVLITMAVIGVVAAITIPLIVENHKKIAVATQLKKFYSNTNQAIKLHKAREGEDLSDYAMETTDSQELLNFYENTIGPHLVDISHYQYNEQFIGVQFNDGSGFYGYSPNTDIIHIFFCVEFRHCKPEGASSMDGRNTFLFTIHRNENEMITAYRGLHSLSREQLLTQCKYGNTDNAAASSQGRRHTCSRLIEIDGWQVKKDYPWKQRTVPTS